jgi:branched-chain amino acid transport system substrate-binding protein
MKQLIGLLCATALTLGSSCAYAQLVIGQTSGFTGPAAGGVKENTLGANLYLDAVNARGGVGGQTVQLISLDDKFDPKQTAENARKLIEEHDVLALFLTRGTPHTEATLPLLEKYGVPMIGPSTGAMVLHDPVRKYVFNVRTSYQREAEKAVAHMVTIGMTRIAIAYTDDSFGADGLAGVQKGLSAAKLTPVVLEKFDRTNPDFSGMAPIMAKSSAHAIVLIGSSNTVAQAIKAFRAAGTTAQFITLSNNASEGFIKSLGDDARNIIVTQVFPRSLNYAIVREANELARKKNMTEVSPAMLEGFAAAKVLVEALRRSGSRPTRERLVTALESMKKFDLGGMELTYSPTNHSGLDFTDLSIISQGKFVR